MYLAALLPPAECKLHRRRGCASASDTFEASWSSWIDLFFFSRPANQEYNADAVAIKSLKALTLSQHILTVLPKNALRYASSPVVDSLIFLGTPFGLDSEARWKDLTAKPPEKSKCFLAPLQSAVVFGHADVALFLIEKGANVSLKSYHQWTFLHQAADCKYETIFDLLLQQGLDLWAQCHDGSTPLHEAVRVGLLEIVETYLRMAANDSGALSTLDESGMSALFAALSHGNVRIARSLVSAGADVHLVGDGNQSTVMKAALLNDVALLRNFLEAEGGFDYRNSNGWTALHFAAMKPPPAVFEVLITTGAAIDAATLTKQSPVMTTAGRGNQEFDRVRKQ